MPYRRPPPKIDIPNVTNKTSINTIVPKFVTLFLVRTFCFVFTFRRFDDGIKACADAAIIISVAKTRTDLIPDNLIAQGIRQRPFQSVTDFKPYLLIILCDENKKAVVSPFRSDFIRFCDL